MKWRQGIPRIRATQFQRQYHCQDQALADLKSLDRMRSCLEWSDVDLMRSIFLFLDTQSWQLQVAEESSEDNRLSEVLISFELPLKSDVY